VANSNIAPEWQTYFCSIKSVCPWSYNAMQQDNILVVQNAVPEEIATWYHIFRNQHVNHEAFVFCLPDHSDTQLAEISANLEISCPLGEWLWSHPDHEPNSTPVPTIILQDPQRLEQIRRKIGYYDD